MPFTWGNILINPALDEWLKKREEKSQQATGKPASQATTDSESLYEAYREALEEAAKVADLLYGGEQYTPLPKPPSVQLGEFIERLGTPQWKKGEGFWANLLKTVFWPAAAFFLSPLYGIFTTMGRQPTVEEWNIAEAERERAFKERQQTQRAGTAASIAGQVLRAEESKREKEREVLRTIPRLIESEYSRRALNVLSTISEEQWKRLAEAPSESWVTPPQPIEISVSDITGLVATTVDRPDKLARLALVNFADRFQRAYGVPVQIVDQGERVVIPRVPIRRRVQEVSRQVAEEAKTMAQGGDTISSVIASVYGTQTTVRGTEGQREVKERVVTFIEPVSGDVVHTIRVGQEQRERVTQTAPTPQQRERERAQAEREASQKAESFIGVIFNLPAGTSRRIVEMVGGAPTPPEGYVKDPLGVFTFPGSTIARKVGTALTSTDDITKRETWETVENFTQVARRLITQAPREAFDIPSIIHNAASVALERAKTGVGTGDFASVAQAWPRIQQRALELIQKGDPQSLRQVHELFWGLVGVIYAGQAMRLRPRSR